MSDPTPPYGKAMTKAIIGAREAMKGGQTKTQVAVEVLPSTPSAEHLGDIDEAIKTAQSNGNLITAMILGKAKEAILQSQPEIPGQQ